MKIPVDARLRDLGSNPERDALLLLVGIARHLAALSGHKNLVWVASDNVLADWSNSVSHVEKTTKFLDPLSIRLGDSERSSRELYPLDASQLDAGVIGADLGNRNVQAIGTSGRDQSTSFLG